MLIFSCLNKINLRYAAIVIFGFLLVILGIFDFYRTAAFYVNTTSTTGTITESEYRPTGRGHYGQFLSVKYSANGSDYLCESREPVGIPQRQIGEAIEVYYKNDAPSKCRIYSFASHYVMPAFLTLMGLFFIVTMIAVIIRRNRVTGRKSST